MRIDQILGMGRPSVSFEFFPPKSEAGFASLYQTIDDLVGSPGTELEFAL